MIVFVAANLSVEALKSALARCLTTLTTMEKKQVSHRLYFYFQKCSKEIEMSWCIQSEKVVFVIM
jgi:hypothetical protein